MKFVGSLSLLLVATVPLTAQSRSNRPVAGPSVEAPAQVQNRVLDAYGRLPLAFEANQGQMDPQVKFVSRGVGYNLFLTGTEAVLTLRSASRQESGLSGAKTLLPQKEKSDVLRMKLLGSNPATEVSGQDELPGKSNYFIGNDPTKWHATVPRYARVHYANVYPGVDLVYYGNQREMEYDFVLRPGADPSAIRLGIEGATKLRLVRGDLVLSGAGRDVHLRSLKIYQEENGVRRAVRGGYVVEGKNKVGFRLGAYDRRRTLVIDPVLAYSTYLGGSIGDPSFGAAVDSASGIAVDAAGNAYVTGYTTCDDFPTVNPLQPTFAGYTDVFVTKLNIDGSALVYSTYLGGSSGDNGSGIAVDSAGNAYITGTTGSTNFPTVNALQPAFGGGVDGFVTKINADGSALVYSTYLGGSDNDSSSGIAIDAAGNAYVTGTTSSSNFLTLNALQPAYHGGDGDAFVTKINTAGGAVYSTYLGSKDYDQGVGIAVDSAGNTWITGNTESSHFPTVNALQPTYGGGTIDGFVTKINAAGTALVFSTYLGGSDQDEALAVTTDAAGNAYVTGYTRSSNFPIVNAIQPAYGGNQDAFVAKISASGNAFVYSTYFGGTNFSQGNGIAADSTGNAYVTGFTAPSGIDDAFIAKINPGGSALVYSTTLGGSNNDEGAGIAVDSAGSAYVAGTTASKNFPVTAFAFQQSSKKQGSSDAFVAKIGETYVNVSPSNLKFVTQKVGTRSPAKKVTLTNVGTGSLTNNQMYFSGLNASDFAQTNTCGTALAAGASCTILIRFTPVAGGPKQAALKIVDSDLGSPQTVLVSGIATVVSLAPKKLSFGNQPVGTTSAPQSVTLTNAGNTGLNFFGLTITGRNGRDYSQTNNCGASIAAHASCTITVTFSPGGTGTRVAKLSISDDGGGSPQKIPLTGTGT